MIRVTEAKKTAVLEGAPADVMLFYCIWQNSIWPNWMAAPGLSDEKDVARQQHARVIALANAGEEIVLANDGKPFEDALKTAVDTCRNLGVQIDHS